MVGEEWIGSRRFCTDVSRECWWRRRGQMRSASWAGVGGLEELVELFTLGTLDLSGALGLFTLVFTCVLFTIVGIFTGVGNGGMYRGRSDPGLAIGELMWTQLCLGSLGGGRVHASC